MLEGFERGTLRFEILLVDEWTPRRCSIDSPRQYFHLIRIFDTASGKELGRASESWTGHWSKAAFDQPGSPLQPIPSLAGIGRLVSEKLAIETRRPQLVRTHGTLRCEDEVPSAAAEATDGRSVFLLSWDGSLYQVGSGQRVISDARDLADSFGAVERGLAENERFVSLGGDVNARATRIDPEGPPSRGRTGRRYCSSKFTVSVK